VLHIAPTVDAAVAWCEDEILTADAPTVGAGGGSACSMRSVSSSQSLASILQTVSAVRGSRGVQPAVDGARQPAATEAGSRLEEAGSRLEEELLRWFESVQVETGAVLWREGDMPQQALVLVKGRLCAVDDMGAVQETDVAGCMLGEFGLITGESRQNTVTALSPCRLYQLTRERWVQMQDEVPRLAFVLSTVALKYAGNRLRQVAFSAQHAISAVPV
jgi:CRP-like cAMP-binding protein